MSAATTADLDRLSAALTGRYRLERELGRGGMATVYLARDLRHDRQVALKVLRPELAAPRGIARFQREIRLTARLEHPGILPLFDSGEAAGQLWYAMPYVEGGTIRERLRQSGPLPVSEAVALVQEVLAALAYAHRQGVIHRDLKPENILLSSSGPVIADFGIARALGGAGLATSALTETGTALGTPEYMSPEQVAGRRVDGRSDLYAVATILYELLAGEPPYTGPSAQAVIAKRLTAPVPRISILRSDVRPGLERVLLRALAKAPADRYATAGDLSAALGAALTGTSISEASSRPTRWRRLAWRAAAAAAALAISAAVFLRSTRGATPGTAPDPHLVAVLPFTVTAPDSASNYLREGVVDLLGARLTGQGVPRAVDSRTLLARWRRVGGGRALTRDQALALANGLGAGQLIVGEVTRAQGRTTIRGRLLRVPSGAVLVEHTESAAGELDELALVDRWVNRIFFVGAGEGTGRLANFSDSAEAVKAFLAARAAHNRGEHDVAAVHYERALTIESTFALAAYWLTQADLWRGAFWPDHYRRAWSLRHGLSERDRAQLQAEMAIGPRYPEPYTSAELIRAAERAAALNPERPEAWARLGIYLLIQGAAASVTDWLPRSAAALDSATALDSTHTDPVWYRFYAALLEGNRESIRRFATHYLRAGPRGDRALMTRWMAAHALGDSAAFDSLIAQPDRYPIFPLFDITGLTAIVGLPLDPLDRTLQAYPSGGGATREAICLRVILLQMVAAMRGQVARSLAYADSSNRMPDCGSRQRTIALALADPGYGNAPEPMAREVATVADTTSDGVGALCAIELWRLHRGDTSRVSQALHRLPRMVDRPMRQMPFGPRTCIRVLAAGLEALRGGAGPTPELERLDSLMREGVFMETPAGIANLVLARRFAARGEDARALAAVRRRIYNHNPNIAVLYPAHLQEEGRLAALTGDTAGAIRAYRHYLVLRDRPDPGPMREQVDGVRAHLAELVGEPRR